MTDYPSDKGPFKGKGGTISLDLGQFEHLRDWRELVSAFRGLPAAEVRLEELEALRGRLKSLTKACVDDFKSAYPSAPVYLERSPDRANTVLRWRLRGGAYPRTELDSTECAPIMKQLPTEVARDWLRFEEYRIQINYYLAQVVYEIQRLKDHIDRLVALRKLRKRHVRKTDPTGQRHTR